MGRLGSLGLSGLSASSLKKHPAIIPIFGLVGLGAALAGGYLWRLAYASPEVSWNRHGNPEPWNEYADKQYKFLASGRDYSKGTPAPNYKEGK